MRRPPQRLEFTHRDFTVHSATFVRVLVCSHRAALRSGKTLTYGMARGKKWAVRFNHDKWNVSMKRPSPSILPASLISPDTTSYLLLAAFEMISDRPLRAGQPLSMCARLQRRPTGPEKQIRALA